MIKKYFPALFILSLCFTFIACNKSDDNGPSNSMTASPTDSTFSANLITAGPVNGKFIISGTVINNGSYTQNISLVLNNYNYTTDTLYINGTDIKASYTTNLVDSNTANSGQIAITAATSHSVQGTFYFYCYSGIAVTGGSFYATWK